MNTILLDHVERIQVTFIENVEVAVPTSIKLRQLNFQNLIFRYFRFDSQKESKKYLI